MDEPGKASILIAGAGPAGLMLAGELCLAGARVIVLEERPEPAVESRASTLHARTMEVFDQRGLLDELSSPPHQRMGHFGGLPLDLGALATRYPGQWKVSQAQVERLLTAWATDLGADLRRGHRVVGFTTVAGGVAVHAVGPDGPLLLRGSHLVGCDGEQSDVRRLAGIELNGLAATRQLYRADVLDLDIRPRRFERLPAGLAIAGAIAPGVTRIMVSEFGDPSARAAPAGFADVCGAWHRVTGEDIGAGKPLWVNAFDNASLLAARFQQGRVLLAGDAAHLQMPSGGQAINLALQDAVNLGWKLAAEVAGTAPPGLLASYHQERHAVARRVLGNIRAQSALLLGAPDVEPVRSVLAELIELPQVRDLLAGLISGLDVRYPGGDHPLEGARLADVPLIDGRRVLSSTELLRGGQGLLLDLTGDPTRQAVLDEAVRACAGRVELVCAQPASNGPVAGLDTVLLRPDGHVAWVGCRTQHPGAALHSWFG